MRSVALWGLGLTVALAVPSHAQSVDAHDPAIYDAELFAAIDAHLTDQLGSYPNVWHEKVSPDIHVDLIPIPPKPGRDFWVIATAGMSYKEMTVPKDIDNRDTWLHAELMVALPKDWFGGQPLDTAIEDEAVYYPIRRLKQLARYPHNNATGFAASHTFKFSDPLGPGTKMNSVVFWWPTFIAEGDDIIRLPDGRTINLYAIIPIYEAERQYAVDNGTTALLDLLGEAKVTSLFDPTRPPVVKE